LIEDPLWGDKARGTAGRTNFALLAASDEAPGRQLLGDVSLTLGNHFTSSRHEVLTDFLASWERLPGTVAYAGYGSIIERKGWDGSGLIDAPPAPTAPRSGASSSRRPTSTASDGGLQPRWDIRLGALSAPVIALRAP
jgi:hypothetical protein